MNYKDLNNFETELKDFEQSILDSFDFECLKRSEKFECLKRSENCEKCKNYTECLRLSELYISCIKLHKNIYEFGV